MSQQVPPWNVNFLLAVAVARLDAVAEEQESGLMQHTVHQRCFLARNFSSKSSPKEAGRRRCLSTGVAGHHLFPVCAP